MRNSLFEYRAGNAQPFGVTTVPGGVQFAVYLPQSEVCYLKLYRKGRKRPEAVIALKDKFKVGSVFFVTISKAASVTDERSIEQILTQDFEYTYEADGVEFVDPYAAQITGRQHWGKRDKRKPMRGRICLEEFAWGEDMPLRIPYSDLILYQLHVRGYTKHNTSKVTHRGTFQGLLEKIPYLKDLGINAVMLLPVYEFDEMPLEDEESYRAETQDALPVNGGGRLNYWGYGAKNTFYFAPKAAYATEETSPSVAFKELVRELHKNGIEVLLDIYFLPGTNLFLMTDCLRSWVLTYHVDGFRVNQDVMPSLTLASDPILSGVKLLTDFWDVDMLHNAHLVGQKNALGVYNEGFMNDVRRFLKGDEGMVEKVAACFQRNATQHSYINFVTHVNGFTMMDLVSYDIKHNEENGESNQDGTEYNYSWNCGVEGKTRKKAVLDRRMIQIRNAFLMLLTSQSAPMILAGDELGNTQYGNNNAYCQDNETGWINWRRTKTAETIHAFVKNMIQLRRAFPVLHQKNPLMLMDTLSCGVPDLSIHGIQAWRPDFSNYSRMLGMLYYGGYVEEGEGRSVYVIYNMYWEAKSFDLPNLPQGRTWKVMVDSYDNTFDASLLRQKKRKNARTTKKRKPVVLSKKTVVPPRSIVVFVESV